MRNPYWDSVREHLTSDPWDGLVVSWNENPTKSIMMRREMVQRYSWTITSPEAVAFVAENAGDGLIDPLAGTGYWGYVLAQAGVDVLSTDLHPADGTGRNGYHRECFAHTTVLPADAVAAVGSYPGRVLLLSWPPYGDLIGEFTIRAYEGNRIIYIGEEGGCCGTDSMLTLLESEWVEIGRHRPPRWWGLYDEIIVFDRKVDKDG